MRTYRLAKRVIDIVGAGAVLLLSLPVLAVTSIGVRVALGSPVLFRQTRPGLNAELFEIYKFRTMKDGSGSDAERMTRFGSALRSLSLDELPALLNVLKGEMSLVGPRPLLPDYLDHYDSRQALRHEVRPGVTGLAQVSGRNNIGWDERLELDVKYVEGMSLKLDLHIIIETATTVLKRKGVNAEGHATMPAFVGSEVPEILDPKQDEA